MHLSVYTLFLERVYARETNKRARRLASSQQEEKKEKVRNTSVYIF